MSTNFSDLGVRAQTVKALNARGFTEPFPIQKLVIADALAGRDVLGRSQTGSGKTLAFAVPIVDRLDPEERGPAALVLVPTRELAVQVFEDFGDIAKVNDLRVAVAYGGVGLQPQARSAPRSHILIATPGRLEDLATRGMVRLDAVRILVLDEADRMLDMGFQPQVDRIVRRLTRARQTMFFSATLDGRVGRLASSYTKDAVLHEIDSDKPTVDEVVHAFKHVSKEGKVDTLVELLGNDREHVLVFVRTKRGAARLAAKLRERRVSAVAMHGDLTQSQRERSWAMFQSGRANVLIATDVAARGLDHDSISHVINFDPPEDETAYVHRIGRTARAGRSGSGITLVSPEQRGDIARMASRLDLHHELERDGLKIPPPAVVFSSGRGRSRGIRRRRRAGIR